MITEYHFPTPVYIQEIPNAVRRTLAANMDVEYNPVATRSAG